MHDEAKAMGAQWKAKHREEAANAKGKLFTKLSKEIMVAARNGADPEMNPRLRLAIDAAKKASMTRETLERAIKKGSGQLDGAVTYEKVTYEGFAPHQVPVIVECLTDNVNRTISSMRVLFRKGQLGSSGSVSWDFEHLGIIEASPASADSEAELAAIEAGAQDFDVDEDGTATFYTDLTDVDLVSKALPAQGFTVVSAKLGYRPKNPMTLSDEAMAEVETFLAAIDNDDDVHEVYVGLAG
jgi:YebC/PmpR family DNA-binding regulatory protein